mgnify:CR=1 FL=1
MTQEENQKAFEEIVRPVMKWLAENQHPHVKIIIESNVAEMVEGCNVISTNEYLVD